MRAARLVSLAVLTPVAGGCAGAGVIRVADTVPVEASTQLSHNQQEARHDAVKLLESVRLPAGTVAP